MRRLLLLGCCGALTLAGACSEKPSAKESLRALAPEPLPRLGARDGGAAERDAVHVPAASPVFGDSVPARAVKLSLKGEAGPALLAGVPADAPVLLEPDEETYLVQVAPLLAALEDAGREVWLLHPDGAVAYPLALRDEPGFQAWLDEAKPGKVRVIQRADGYELQTNVGKLPGPDPNGPTVPVRGGRLDVATMREGMSLLAGRFGVLPDACLVPSFGTELRKIAVTLSGFYKAPGAPFFGKACLVYPRPRAAAAGAKDGG